MIARPTTVPPSTDAEAYARAAVEASFDPAEGNYVDWTTVQRMLAIAWQSGHEAVWTRHPNIW